MCGRWKLSSNEIARIGWLIRSSGVLEKAAEMPWSALQKYMVDDGIEDLLALDEAVAAEAGRPLDFVEFCRERLRLPADVLNPAPLFDGRRPDRAHGYQPRPRIQGFAGESLGGSTRPRNSKQARSIRDCRADANSPLKKSESRFLGATAGLSSSVFATVSGIHCWTSQQWHPSSTGC